MKETTSTEFVIVNVTTDNDINIIGLLMGIDKVEFTTNNAFSIDKNLLKELYEDDTFLWLYCLDDNENYTQADEDIDGHIKVLNLSNYNIDKIIIGELTTTESNVKIDNKSSINSYYYNEIKQQLAIEVLKELFEDLPKFNGSYSNLIDISKYKNVPKSLLMSDKEKKEENDNNNRYNGYNKYGYNRYNYYDYDTPYNYDYRPNYNNYTVKTSTLSRMDISEKDKDIISNLKNKIALLLEDKYTVEVPDYDEKKTIKA